MPNLLSNDKKGKIKKMSTFNISEIGCLLWEPPVLYIYLSFLRSENGSTYHLLSFGQKI